MAWIEPVYHVRTDVNAVKMADNERKHAGLRWAILAWPQWRPGARLDNAEAEAMTTGSGEVCTTGCCLLGWLLVPSRTSLHSSIFVFSPWRSYTCVSVFVVALLCGHLVPSAAANVCLPRLVVVIDRYHKPLKPLTARPSRQDRMP